MIKGARGILAKGEAEWTFPGDSAVRMPRTVRHSLDGGVTWRDLPVTQAWCMDAVEFRKRWICAGQLGNLYSSMDSGKTWQNVPIKWDLPGADVWTFSDSCGIWATIEIPGQGLRLFFSVDGVLPWSDRTPPRADLGVTSRFIKKVGNYHVLLAAQSLFISSDTGKNWIERPLPDAAVSKYYYAMTATNSKLWMENNTGNKYVSKDWGVTWTALSALGQAGQFWADGRYVVIQGGTNQMSISDDEGETWEEFNTESLIPVWKGDWHGKKWMACNFGLYQSLDSGRNWKRKEVGISVKTFQWISGFTVRGDSMLASTEYGLYLGNGNGENWRSLNSKNYLNAFGETALEVGLGDGIGWITVKTRHSLLDIISSDGLYNYDIFKPVTLHSVAALGGEIRGLSDQGLLGYRPGETGLSWFPSVFGQENHLPHSLIQEIGALEGKVYSLTAIGLYQSTDSGKQWNPVLSPLRFPTKGRLLQTETGLWLSDLSGVWYTSSTQKNWTSVLDQGKAVTDTLLYAWDQWIGVHGTLGYRVWNTVDSTWTTIDSLPGKWIGVQNRRLFATHQTQLYISEDIGHTWRKALDNGCTVNNMVDWQVIVLGDRIVANQGALFCGAEKASAGGPVWVSDNGGLSWKMGDSGTVFGTSRDPIWVKQSGPFTWWNLGSAPFEPMLFIRDKGQPSFRIPWNPLSLAHIGETVFASDNKNIYSVLYPLKSSVGIQKTLPKFTQDLPKPGLIAGISGHYSLKFQALEAMTIVITVTDLRGRVLIDYNKRVSSGPVLWDIPIPQSGLYLVTVARE
jgi:hypothetical protein